MTTKELINQYVTAHAENRWMDASELEALLTEFAEKLKANQPKTREALFREYMQATLAERLKFDLSLLSETRKEALAVLTDLGYECKLPQEPASEDFMYNLKLTERQARLLSWACDHFSRLIEGQDWTYQELFEAAWEKRCKEAVGHGMDKEWDGGWYVMREEAEALTKQIKKRFWGLESNAMYGIYYDKSADILWDLHRVIRHQLWEDNPEHLQSTVDAESPTSPIGDEPLAKIERID